MAILSGYEYDIFISYRHNDNRSGWVTEFVNALQEELAATIKEPLCIYFDKNPHDGLLETHNVDKSLEGKLKCLIFIPIISQTYCDPKSFAWQHEFVAFNKLAKEDQFGRDIKLNNGNVASRILPVKIHDLDPEDLTLLESEIGGVLRAIEFIFRSPGINRSLIAREEHPQDNLNKTFYRDQINKSAQSIKQILTGLKQSNSGLSTPPRVQKKDQPNVPGAKLAKLKKWSLAFFAAIFFVVALYYLSISLLSKSTQKVEVNRNKIAVLPFVNLSGNDDNEYFSDGITEDIINHISKVSDIKVISRSSVMRYKGTSKDIVEIGNELGVQMILEGTVRLTGNRSRITANLINTINREQIWAESYDREIKDLFSLQADVASDIVSALKANFNDNKNDKIPTRNLEAYDLYLRANYNFAKATKQGYKTSAELCEQAIKLDPQFALCYARLADSYSLIVYYQFYDIMSLDSARQRALYAARKSIEIDPNLSEGYSSYAYALRTLQWNWEESEKQVLKGLSINPDNTSLRRRYALLLALQGKFEEAITQSKYSHDLDPLGSIYNSDIARIYYYSGNTSEMLKMAQYAFQVEPNYRPAMGTMALGLERSGLLDSSVVWVSKSSTRTGTDYEGLPETFITIPKAYKQFWNEVLKQSIADLERKHIPSMAMAVLCMRNDDREGAIKFLTKGYQAREGSMVYINAEPLFNPLHEDPRYREIIIGMNLKP